MKESATMPSLCSCQRPLGPDKSEFFCDTCFKRAVTDWERDKLIRRNEEQAQKDHEDFMLVQDFCRALGMPLERVKRALALIPNIRSKTHESRAYQNVRNPHLDEVGHP